MTNSSQRNENGLAAETRTPRAYVFYVAFWAGFFVMMLEILGGRSLAPYFGSGVHVWGSVIFVFMLSLSIGYLLGGRLSRAEAKVSRLVQLMIAAGLATIPCLLTGDLILELLEQSGADPRLGAVTGAVLLFLLPTTLWGMVSPYSVRLLVHSADDSGESAGRLYFISTAGSSAGTLLTSFYLVLWFDANTILVSLIVGSILTGALGLVLGGGTFKSAA